MQSENVSYREVIRLENARREEMLRGDQSRKNSTRDNRLSALLVMIISLLLIGVGGGLLFALVTMVLMNPVHPIW